MQSALRKQFDAELEVVLADAPDTVRRLLDQVPLVVEDHPSKRVLAQFGLRHRQQLCGLYTGIPLTRRSIEQSGVLSDVIYLFREGILEMARQSSGDIDQRELREQIRITLLHELGHHHGLDEDELRALGY